MLSEAVHFYGYLEQQLADQAEKVQLVMDFRLEMRGIAREVARFIRKWQDAGLSADTVFDFLEEYHQVGQVLQRRIQVEESDLYPLYQPPG